MAKATVDSFLTGWERVIKATPRQKKLSSKDMVSGWSCDNRDRGMNCRQPHGCHCREITALRDALATDDGGRGQ